MSYREWTYNGYGIFISDYSDKITEENVVKLLEKAPTVKESFNVLITEGLTTLEAVDEYEGNFTCLTGVGALLCDVMNECEEDITFDAVDDFDGEQYVLLLEQMPWHMTEREKALTPESLTEIFKKYCDILIDGKYSIGDYEVCNGG